MSIHQTISRAAVTLLAIAGLPVLAAAQMPDARQMSGIPMPTSDVPAGSVSVRLVRGELTNNIVGHPVELHAGARTETVKTDQDGRAVFAGLQPGATVHATADVDGQRIESQTFNVPPDAGVRLVLVAGASGAPAGASAHAGGRAGRGGVRRQQPDPDRVR